MYVWRKDLPAKAARIFALPRLVLEKKYWMDDLWIGGFAGTACASVAFREPVDEKLVDGVGQRQRAPRRPVRRPAAAHAIGYLYDYAFAMILGLIALLAAILMSWH